MSDPSLRCPPAGELARRLLARDDIPGKFDKEIAKNGVVYIRGYDLPVDTKDLKEFREALRTLDKVRKRVVLKAAKLREEISREKAEARRS